MLLDLAKCGFEVPKATQGGDCGNLFGLWKPESDSYETLKPMKLTSSQRWLKKSPGTVRKTKPNEKRRVIYDQPLGFESHQLHREVESIRLSTSSRFDKPRRKIASPRVPKSGSQQYVPKIESLAKIQLDPPKFVNYRDDLKDTLKFYAESRKASEKRFETFSPPAYRKEAVAPSLPSETDEDSCHNLPSEYDKSQQTDEQEFPSAYAQESVDVDELNCEISAGVNNTELGYESRAPSCEEEFKTLEVVSRDESSCHKNCSSELPGMDENVDMQRKNSDRRHEDFLQDTALHHGSDTWDHQQNLALDAVSQENHESLRSDGEPSLYSTSQAHPLLYPQTSIFHDPTPGDYVANHDR